MYRNIVSKEIEKAGDYFEQRQILTHFADRVGLNELGKKLIATWQWRDLVRQKSVWEIPFTPFELVSALIYEYNPLKVKGCLKTDVGFCTSGAALDILIQGKFIENKWHRNDDGQWTYGKLNNSMPHSIAALLGMSPEDLAYMQTLNDFSSNIPSAIWEWITRNHE